MRTILTQQQARPARALEFCYFCGGAFTNDPELINAPDHIPPKAVFNSDDRNWPMKVACHWHCNQERSMTDRKSAQLVGGIRGQFPDVEDFALSIESARFGDDNIPIGILSDLNLHAEIWRWVRGFHAALYREFVPDGVTHKVYAPLPSGVMTDDGPEVIEDHLDVQAAVIQQLRLNAAAERLDEINFTVQSRIAARKWFCYLAF